MVLIFIQVRVFSGWEWVPDSFGMQVASVCNPKRVPTRSCQHFALHTTFTSLFYQQIKVGPHVLQSVGSRRARNLMTQNFTGKNQAIPGFTLW
jgi:hypothetical protein